MSESAKSLVITVGSTTLIGTTVSYVSGGDTSLFLAYGVSMLIQSIVFIHASGITGNKRTEKYFDITGSLTFLTLIIFSSCYNGLNKLTVRKAVLAGFAICWAARLGFFLFSRICHEGGIDVRFNEVKKDVFLFAKFWWIQGLWVWLTLLPIQLALSSSKRSEPYPTSLDIVGTTIWVIGFVIEIIADFQKQQWKNSNLNAGKFINTGLWAFSRHPNYFGEISLWIGIFLIACNEFMTVNKYVSVISPIFTAFLLIFVSGIPLLEKSADKKWGDDPAYVIYKKTTSVLVPWF
jgi:steroid 5-alpha reductase family enzyme